ncbi:MAG: TIGR01440 family protein [Oscillospiraceae bacterium]|nr:TIGR01440 family protein [Oscillospiraceae bacterium]
MLDGIAEDARAAAIELLAKSKLVAGQIVIVGCSTSEVAGYNVGTNSNAEIGAILFDVLYEVFCKHGVYLAAQCCEHLNRAIITQRAASANCTIVNVVPKPKAGGAFAAASYAKFQDPVALSGIRADAGIDIGNTLIGMHLKEVAIPLRLSVTHIGKAAVVAARTRPPLIGGIRAEYDETLF